MPEGDRQEGAARAGDASGPQRPEDVMSQAILEDRVGTLEDRVGELKMEQVRQGERLGRIETDGGKTLAAVEKLVERERKRPDGITWSQFGAGALSMLTLCAALWWTVNGLVEHSEAVVQINKRLDHAEFKYGWATRVEP